MESAKSAGLYVVAIPGELSIKQDFSRADNVFKNLKDRERGIAYTPNPDERITALARHTEYFNEFLDGWKNFAIMKKHFKAYISGWDGAKNLRGELMETNSAKEALRILQIAKR